MWTNKWIKETKVKSQALGTGGLEGWEQKFSDNARICQGYPKATWISHFGSMTHPRLPNTVGKCPKPPANRAKQCLWPLPLKLRDWLLVCLFWNDLKISPISSPSSPIPFFSLMNLSWARERVAQQCGFARNDWYSCIPTLGKQSAILQPQSHNSDNMPSGFHFHVKWKPLSS